MVLAKSMERLAANAEEVGSIRARLGIPEKEKCIWGYFLRKFMWENKEVCTPRRTRRRLCHGTGDLKAYLQGNIDKQL
jgi:hypothetical protein